MKLITNMKLITTSLVLMFSLCLANAQTEQRGGKQVQSMTIARSGSQPSSQGQAEYFTGSVRIDPLFPVTEPAGASAARVTLSPAPGRRGTHTHSDKNSL